MRIYLDCCCLQRPLDDQSQPRIRVEAEAVLTLLAIVQAQDITLLNSEALEYEISRIPNSRRRNEVSAILSLATERLELTDKVVALAVSLEKFGVKSMDAVHMALASSGTADFFCTCDDRLLSKGQTMPGLTCKVISVLSLVEEVTK